MGKPRLVFIEVPLPPTHLNLDVVVCRSKKAVTRFLSDRYKETVGYYEEVVNGPMVATIYHDGEARILMVLRSFAPGIVGHEAVHVTWKLADAIGMKWDSNSQEIQAYYVTYIVDKIMEHK